MNPEGNAKIQKSGLWPGFKLSEAFLNAGGHISPVLYGNSSVQNKVYGSYSREVVASDHFVTGLLTNVLECWFYEIQEASYAELLDARL